MATRVMKKCSRIGPTLVICLLIGRVLAGFAPSASAQSSSDSIYFPPPGQAITNQFLTTPQEVGLSPSIVTDLESVIGAGRWALWRHGYLVHVDGDFNQNGSILSARKTIHAATVGAGIQRGLIPSLNQEISDWNPGLTGLDADATWFHVLTQTSAFDEPTLAPGSLWAYSDANPFQLNATGSGSQISGRQQAHVLVALRRFYRSV